MAPYKELVSTITSDNRREFYEHKKNALKLAMGYYFVNVYYSWEKGLNEYQNKLMRQFTPKKFSFNH
jgi:IS30 family transposase